MYLLTEIVIYNILKSSLIIILIIIDIYLHWVIYKSFYIDNLKQIVITTTTIKIFCFCSVLWMWKSKISNITA